MAKWDKIKAMGINCSAFTEKAREAFLICKGRTIDPHGLNIREETY